MKLHFVDEPKNDLELLDFFAQQAEAVDESDYGDCMREWNRELLYVRSHLREPKKTVLEKLDEMQKYIQFTPNWDVASTRARILKDVSDLRALYP